MNLTGTVSVGLPPPPDVYVRASFKYEHEYDRRKEYKPPSGLTPEQEKRLRDASAAFRTYDKDENGYLDRKEFKAALQHLGYKWEKKKGFGKKLYKLVDKDGNGQVSEREFTEFWLFLKSK